MPSLLRHATTRAHAGARALRLASALTLVACGGSGASTETTAVAPSITTQPSAVTAAVGGSASFTVAASGSGTLAYQWRKGGASISGATGASYTRTGLTVADSGSYDVVVSNAAGSVTSAAARLTVTGGSGAPTITTPPLSQSVATGTPVTFTVVAGGTAPFTYQWRKGGAAISGATAASYTIASAASTDAGSYDVVVTNSVGSVTSAAATLTVTTTTGGSLSAQVTAAAQAFLATLSTTQQATALQSYSVATARRWSNLPAAMVARNGVSWGSLSTAQQTAARTLITTALSTAGNDLHIGMQAADDYLAANGGGATTYGNGQYYIAFLGTPSATGYWMLQLSGHHLTFNLAFNGTYKSPTPLFLGIEPKASFTQGGRTYDPMATQRNAMAALGAVLLTYPSARLTGTYADLLFGANGAGGIDNTCPRTYSSVTERGMLYTSLSTADQALAQAAITAYVNTQAGEYASDLLASYLSPTSLAATYVSYAGAGNVTGNGSYFRFDGPRLWIEFSVQRGVIFNNDIHYHTIWRDKVGDYGGTCQ